MLSSLIAWFRFLLLAINGILLVLLPTYAIYFISAIMLGIIGVYCKKVEGYENVKYAVQTKQPFIILFNHPTFYDPFVLYNTLKMPLRFVAKDNHVKMFGSFMDKYRLIQVTNTGGATKRILNAIPYTRILGTIAIAPTGGTGFEEDSTYLPDFKTGAFVPMVPVLPVLIRYSSREVWKKGVPLHSIFWKRLHGSHIDYSVKILPLIKPDHNWSHQEYAQYTHRIMQKELRAMTI